jgi:hypothetical protein
MREAVLAADKSDRLAELLRRLRNAAPFDCGAVARMALEDIMRAVEDELSGIRENPNAATSPPDGRMYPPDDKFEVASGSPLVRTFKQTRHRTSIGENGSLQIIRSDGNVEIDLCGSDGRTVAELAEEQKNESR